MSSETEELIYSQSDMDGVLAKLRDAQKEVEQSHQLLWATVFAAGGHVAIPLSVWMGAPDRQLMFWDEPATSEMHIKVVNEYEPDREEPV